MRARQFTRFTNGMLFPQTAGSFSVSTLQLERGLAWNVLEHLRVGREFFHKHQETLNGFLRFVPGETAPDEIDFFQFPRLQKQFLSARSGEEDVDGRINSLIAD